MLLIFNEKDNIAPLSLDILRVYERADIRGEVLLVDDGSTDGSGQLCDDLAGKYPQVRAIHHEKNRGRSFAIETGFNNARGDITILMDGDRQYEPKEIPDFMRKMEEGWDVVSGRRKERKDNWIRRFISQAYNNWIIGYKLGLDIIDQNSGFKSIRTCKVKRLGFNPRGFYGLHRFILPLAVLKGLSVTEIPIAHLDRPTGRSYIRFYTVPFITYIDYKKFRKRYKKEIEMCKRKS